MKIVKEETKEITILNREIAVWVREYDSGVQRVGAFFVDRNRTYLTRQNILLRKRIQELEEKLKNEKQTN